MNRGFTYIWEKNKSLISPGERDLENEYGEIRALEREREAEFGDEETEVGRSSRQTMGFLGTRVFLCHDGLGTLNTTTITIQGILKLFNDHITPAFYVVIFIYLLAKLSFCWLKLMLGFFINYLRLEF